MISSSSFVEYPGDDDKLWQFCRISDSSKNFVEYPGDDDKL